MIWLGDQQMTNPQHTISDVIVALRPAWFSVELPEEFTSTLHAISTHSCLSQNDCKLF